MEDKSRNIIDFYVEANDNKYKIASSDSPRDYSVAEVTILGCIDALARHSVYSGKEANWDVNKVIRMILLDSVRDKMDGLSGKNKYDDILNQLNDTTIEETVQARSSVFNVLIGFKDQSDTINNLLKNYSKLRTTIRQGHIYWGANGDRLESILEHVYGTMILCLGIESEYGYSLDYDKMLTMLLLHETEEIKMGDLTEWDGITPEQRIELGKKAVKDILGGLKNSEYYIKLLDEFNAHNTIESEYTHLIDKLEYDMQVKMYQTQGRYDFEHRPENVVTTSSSVRKIIEDGANTVFDVHYEYDKHRYHSLPCMRRILEHTKKM